MVCQSLKIPNRNGFQSSSRIASCYPQVYSEAHWEIVEVRLALEMYVHEHNELPNEDAFRQERYISLTGSKELDAHHAAKRYGQSLVKPRGFQAYL